MALTNPYKTYKENSVTQASPAELTLMLYNGALKFSKLAKKAIQENNIQEKNINIQKIQAIIQELMVTLNTDVELSKDLMRLYDFMQNQLIQANVKNDISILEEVEGFFIDFRDTWKEMIQQSRQMKHAQGGQA